MKEILMVSYLRTAADKVADTVSVYAPKVNNYLNAALSFVPLNYLAASAAAVNGVKSLTSYIFDKQECTKESRKSVEVYRKSLSRLESIKPLIAAAIVLKSSNSLYVRAATIFAVFVKYFPAELFKPNNEDDQATYRFKAVEGIKFVQAKLSQAADIITCLAAPVLAYMQKDKISLAATVVNVLSSETLTKCFHKAVDLVRRHDPSSPNYNSRSQQNDEYPLRANVPDNQVSLNVEFENYHPVEFTHLSVKAQPVWADSVDP